MIEKHFKIERFLLYSIVSFSILSAIYLFSTFDHIPVNRDAGYFIPISKAVMNGATPTVDVETGYTPLIYYAYALWMSLWGADFGTLVLLTYLVNGLNAIFLYLILSHFIDKMICKIFLSVSYYYTVMIAQGYSIFIEPFQVLFILLAYYVYLIDKYNFLKFSLMGLLLGISIMFKQYSFFVLLGLLQVIWIDAKKTTKFRDTLSNISLVILFASVPFFAFILFTKADMVGSLYSFGIPGNRSISFAITDQKSLSYFALRLCEQLLHHNWLFIPILLYCYVILFSKGQTHKSRSVLPIWLFSALPIFIRQWGHYFQLIVPWSYIIWGMLLDKVIRGLSETEAMNNSNMTISAFICFFAVLPSFLFLTPTFYSSLTGSDISFEYMAILILLFLLLVSVVLILGAFFSKHKIDTNLVVFVFALVLGFQTIFLASKLPFNRMSEKKEFQIAEAKEINKVFSRGSEVLVIDYNELYVTCDFHSPINEYISFGSRERALHNFHSVDLSGVKNIVLRRNRPVISVEELNRMGFVEVHGSKGLRVSLFSRSSDIVNILTATQ